MRVLVVGGGGREHALVWKLAQSPAQPELFCAPGNAGTAGHATNLPIEAENLQGLLAWCRQNRPELTVIGPEAPLCAGLTDLLQAEGLRVFGPCRQAARLEGSKVFSKEVMLAAGVPTAAAGIFDRPEEALAFVRRHGAPLVVKADGLAAGKGVYVCATMPEAEAAVGEIMVQRVFGEAGRRVLVEDCLRGEEASILALVDGRTVVLLASAQDHKRIGDDDQGPNTGGMGAYSPAPVVTDALWPVIRREVFERTLAELRRRGSEYRGVLYAGLMLTADGPRVLEFNCRFGDPETQAILPRMDCDLVAVLQACADGRLSDDLVRWRPDPCVCVVLASGGYPGPYAKGKVVTGIAQAEAQAGVTVFHAGTRRADGSIVTAGGRVLGVTATGRDFAAAVRQAYAAVAMIRFDQAHHRRDIARRALARG
jgi:phosphoribosylamine--glycine ligase